MGCGASKTLNPAKWVDISKELTEEQIEKILLPNGRPPKILKLHRSADMVGIFMEDSSGQKMLNWLKCAFVVAHRSKKIKQEILEVVSLATIGSLLGQSPVAGGGGMGGMGGMGAMMGGMQGMGAMMGGMQGGTMHIGGNFENLKQYCQDILQSIGRPLDAYYNTHQLADSLGKCTFNLHPDVTNDTHLRLDHPVIGLVPAPSTMHPMLHSDENVYLHVVRMVARTINPVFQSTAKKIIAMEGGTHKGCDIKGDVRIRNKMLSDHKDEAAPRPACNIDVVRMCGTFKTPEALQAAATKLVETYSLGRFKNGFRLSSAAAAEFYHYRSLMLNLIVEAGCTYGEWCQRQDVVEMFAMLMEAKPENPQLETNWAGWRINVKAAIDHLQSDLLKNVQVKMVCEVQLLLEPYLAARGQMHLLYKVARSDTHDDFCAQFSHGGQAQKDLANIMSGGGGVLSQYMVGASAGAAGPGTTNPVTDDAQVQLDMSKFATYSEASEFFAKQVTGMQTGEALVKACKTGCLFAVKAAFSTEALAFTDPVTGLNALHYACQLRQIEVIRYLIDNGADVNALSSKSPVTNGLLLAASMKSVSSHATALQILLDNGANIDAVPEGGEGRSALFAAVTVGDQNLDAVRILCNAGADRNFKCSSMDGVTALELAKFGGPQQMAMQKMGGGMSMDLSKTRLRWGKIVAFMET